MQQSPLEVVNSGRNRRTLAPVCTNCKTTLRLAVPQAFLAHRCANDAPKQILHQLTGFRMLNNDGGERAGLAANAETILRSFHFGSATETFQKSNGLANPRREQPRAIPRGKALGESCAPAFQQLTQLCR